MQKIHFIVAIILISSLIFASSDDIFHREENYSRLIQNITFLLQYRDVGVIRIKKPPENIAPNTIYYPCAVYGNYGDSVETFVAGMTIDSSGVNIWHDSLTVTLDPIEDTTVVFSAWTSCATTGIAYDVKAYTNLVGDMNPANDIMYLQVTVIQNYWEILADLPQESSGHSEAIVYDGYYIVFGFHPSGVYSNTIYKYDIANDLWVTGTSNPYGCGAYGMAYGAAGKYYRFGGTDGWPIALDRVDIYDPVTDTWTAGAAMPIANMDQIGGVYNDSLIFMFGGGNWGGNVSPHTDVYFYDIYEDTWSQATSFPGPGRGCLAGGVVGDYAVVACGYDGTSNYLNDYIVGSIDPANPANITWGTPSAIPGGFEGRYRVSSGVNSTSQWKELFVSCGQGTSTPYLGDIWSYEPMSDTWFEWPWQKYRGIGNVNSLAISYTEIYVVGGYAGFYVTDHESFHWYFGAVEETMKQQVSSSVFGFAAHMKNPTRGYSALSYTTTQSGKVTVKVYDNTGRLVKTLVNRVREPAGTKTVYWNAKDDEFRTVANGVYFVRLEAEGKVDTYKMVLVK